MSGLQSIGERLFVVDGPVARDLGMRWDTRMVVAVLSDGSLWVESPVLVSHQVLTELVALGPVRYVLTSTPRHEWRLGAWHALFPDAELWSCRRTFATVKADVPVAVRRLGDHPDPGWADDFDQVAVKGSFAIEEVCYLHRPSGTLVIGDLIEVLEPVPGKPLRNALLWFGGQAAPGGGTSRDIRVSFFDRRALRASLDRLLAWDFSQVVIGHGPLVTSNAKDFVANAFAWALR